MVTVMISAIYRRAGQPAGLPSRLRDRDAMSIAKRLIAPLRQMPALLAFLAVAGCTSGASPLAANVDFQRDRRMFVAGYEDIDQYYILKEDLGNVTVGGLSALAALDQKSTAHRQTDKL